MTTVDKRWNTHTEDFLTRVMRAHTFAFFPNDPQGRYLTAACRCGWQQFFNLEKDDDPVDQHRAQVALTALADAKLIVEVASDDEESGDQAPPIIERMRAKAKTYRQRAAYEKEHGTESSYHRVLAMAVALEEFIREVS